MRVIFEDALKGLLIKAFKDKADKAIDNVFSSSAVSVEADAKVNAPWTDRTGNARRTLTGVCQCVPYGKKTVSVAGRMSYSPSLELSYGGRYSVLYPTMLNNAQGILRDVTEAVGGVTL